MSRNIKTPSIIREELKKELKKRLNKIHKRLPRYWMTDFIREYPDYKFERTHLSNVSRGLSPDKKVVDLMEQLAEKLSPQKK